MVDESTEEIVISFDKNEIARADLNQLTCEAQLDAIVRQRLENIYNSIVWNIQQIVEFLLVLSKYAVSILKEYLCSFRLGVDNLSTMKDWFFEDDVG